MAETEGARGRFWVSVHYRCCNIYQRVYFKKGTQSASGRCPRCLREVSFELTEDGERGRFFSAATDADF